MKDSEWTKEETDYLFKVVQEYDSRWFVVYDRYEFPGGPTRSLEVNPLSYSAPNLPTKQCFELRI